MRPRICHVIRHSCIRVHKLAQAQRTAKNFLPYLYNARFSSHHPHWQYEMVFKMFDHNSQLMEPQLRSHFRQIARYVDAFHIHNEPDVFCAIARAQTNKPIFWDVHDLRSHQKPDLASEYRPHEDASAEAADHIFTISARYMDILRDRYPKKNVCYYKSMVPREWFPPPLPQKRNGIVYQGGLSQRPGHYRNSFEYWQKCGVPVSIFPAHDVEPGKYMISKNCTMYPITDLFPLYRTLAEYEAGFVGTGTPSPAFDGALPNKLFEYLSCGIPVICANANAVAEFLAEHPKLGVVCNDPAEVPEALKRIKQDNFREHVVKERGRFSMDEENKRVVEPLYRRYLA